MECYKSNIYFDDTDKALRLFFLFLLCLGVYFSCMLLPGHHSSNGFFYSEKISESILIIAICILVNCNSRICIKPIRVNFYISDAIILIELLACILNLLSLLEYMNGEKFFYSNYVVILHTLAAIQFIIIAAGSLCNGLITAIMGIFTPDNRDMPNNTWYLLFHRKTKR